MTKHPLADFAFFRAKAKAEEQAHQCRLLRLPEVSVEFRGLPQPVPTKISNLRYGVMTYPTRYAKKGEIHRFVEYSEAEGFRAEQAAKGIYALHVKIW